MPILLINTKTLQPGTADLQKALGGDVAFLNKHFDREIQTADDTSLVKMVITPYTARQINRILINKKKAGLLP